MIRKMIAALLALGALTLAVFSLTGYLADQRVAESARRALTGKPTSTPSSPTRFERLGLKLFHRQAEERSWVMLGEFQKLMGADAMPAPQAHRSFAALAERLKVAIAAASDTQLRSRLLTLLGLVQARDAKYETVGMSEVDARAEAIASLRTAVLTDPGNDDAKKDLEILMRTDESRKKEMRDTGKGTSGSGKPSTYPAPKQPQSPTSNGGANQVQQGGY